MNDGAEAPESICPAGWRLPYGTQANKSWYYMLSNSISGYGSVSSSTSQAMRTAPFYIPRAGNFAGSFSNVGSYGYYWSSTAAGYSTGGAYSIYFYSSYVNPQSGTGASGGYSVRCVARKTTKTVTVSVNNSSYGSVSTASVIAVEDSAISDSSNTITIGSKTVTATANSGYEFDSWTNNCGSTLTADCTITANFKTPTPFDTAFAAASKTKTSGYYTMQDMTSSICDAVTTPTTTTQDTSTQLIDTRDSKVYWVSKLKDGECWMTQNLDYDIKTSDNIVSKTSEGTATIWSSSYSPHATSTSVFNSRSNTGTYSYDPGSKYLPSGTGTATDITCTSASNGGENCHYHLGNYYQYNAATAGSGGTNTDKDVDLSICPTGWRLPTSHSYTNHYSFGRLTNAYGITSSSTGSSDAALLSSPLWFVRGGRVQGANLGYQGTSGLVWSSMAYPSTSNAYYLVFGSSGVNPSDYDTRYRGLSVRCVAL